MRQRCLAYHRGVNGAAHDHLTAGDEPLDSCRCGRSGQAHRPRDFAMGQAPVDLEEFNDCLVDLVHRGPFAQYFSKDFSTRATQQISRIRAQQMPIM